MAIQDTQAVEEFEDFSRPISRGDAEQTGEEETKSDTVSLLPEGKSETVSVLAGRLEKRVMEAPVSDVEYMGQAESLSKSDLLTLRVDRINKYHEGGRTAAQSLVCFAVLAGMELAAAKKALPHGKYQAWVGANLTGLNYRTAVRYVELFQGLKLKSDTVSLLADNVESLVGKGDDTGPRQRLLLAVHEATEGKSLTELFREFDVIKQLKPAAYHPPKRSESELVADRLATIDARFASLLGLGYEILAVNENFTDATNEREREVKDWLGMMQEKFNTLRPAKGSK